MSPPLLLFMEVATLQDNDIQQLMGIIRSMPSHNITDDELMNIVLSCYSDRPPDTAILEKYDLNVIDRAFRILSYRAVDRLCQQTRRNAACLRAARPMPVSVDYI